MLTGNNEKPDAQWPHRLHGQEWQLYQPCGKTYIQCNILQIRQ